MYINGVQYTSALTSKVVAVINKSNAIDRKFMDNTAKLEEDETVALTQHDKLEAVKLTTNFDDKSALKQRQIIRDFDKTVDETEYKHSHHSSQNV